MKKRKISIQIVITDTHKNLDQENLSSEDEENISKSDNGQKNLEKEETIKKPKIKVNF